MIKKIALACSIMFAAVSTLSAQTVTTKPLTIGEVRTIKSKTLNEDRTLNIYLPQGYDKSKVISGDLFIGWKYE